MAVRETQSLYILSALGIFQYVFWVMLDLLISEFFPFLKENICFFPAMTKVAYNKRDLTKDS